ncbi:MAG TPA: hypothetical protein VFV46_11910 [Lacibacter sp.]|nr:hypothetical protein [Lacibacter sp.]
MKATLFSILFLLFSSVLSAQKKVIKFEKQSLMEGNYEIYYDRYGRETQRFRTGLWKYYYANGKVEAEGEFEKSLKIGNWKFYDLKGSLTEEGEYKKNLRSGVWKTYSGNTVLSLGKYENNLEDGYWKYFYTNGSLLVEGAYKNGLKTGTWKIYEANNVLSAQGIYENNERVGIWISYYEDGAKSSIVDYAKGKRTIYHKNGTVYQEMEFVIGKDAELFMKNFVMYYPNGKKRLEGQFDETISFEILNGYAGWFKLKGVWKSYWENGKLAVIYDFEKNVDQAVNSEFDANYQYQTKSGGTGKGEKILMELDYVLTEDAAWVSFSGINPYPINDAEEEPAKRKFNMSTRQELGNTMLLFNSQSFRRFGPWENYNAKGELESKINYDWITNLPNGAAEFFYPGGALRSEGSFDANGKRTGVWKFYFENGKLKSEDTYDNGKLNGLVTEYFENGNLRYKSAYADDKLVGVKEIYHPNGKLAGRENFKDGKFLNNGDFFDENGNTTLQFGTGYRVDYFANGKLSFKGNYRNGKRDGLNSWYNETGKPKSEFNYSNGVYYGEYKTYFENGTLKERGFYSNEKINGLVEFYHPNGKLLGRNKYNNGVFTGPDDYFDESGASILSNGTGVYYVYNEKGTITYRCNYINYCRSGKAQWYYADGKLEQEAIYKYSEAHKPDGLRWEIVSSFDKDGKERDKGNLKNGNGIWVSYDENGKATETEYVNGIKK